MSSLNILQNYEFMYDAIKKMYKQSIGKIFPTYYKNHGLEEKLLPKFISKYCNFFSLKMCSLSFAFALCTDRALEIYDFGFDSCFSTCYIQLILGQAQNYVQHFLKKSDCVND